MNKAERALPTLLFSKFFYLKVIMGYLTKFEEQSIVCKKDDEITLFDGTVLLRRGAGVLLFAR